MNVPLQNLKLDSDCLFVAQLNLKTPKKIGKVSLNQYKSYRDLSLKAINGTELAYLNHREHLYSMNLPL